MAGQFKLGERVSVQGIQHGFVVSRTYGARDRHGVRYGINLDKATCPAQFEVDASQIAAISYGENSNIQRSNN